jgi:hypothetical protein
MYLNLIIDKKPLSNRSFISIYLGLTLGFVYLKAGFSKLASNYISSVIGPSQLSVDLFSAQILYLFYSMAFLRIEADVLTTLHC